MNPKDLEALFRNIDAECRVPDDSAPTQRRDMRTRPQPEEQSAADRRRAEMYEDVGDPLSAIRGSFSAAVPVVKTEVDEGIGKSHTEYQDAFEKDADLVQYGRTQKLGL